MSRLRVALVLVCCLSSVSTADDAPPLALFSRGIMEDIQPTDLPQASEKVTAVEFVALRDEFEPFSLALRASSASTWRIEVTTLIDPRDPLGTLPPSCLEIALLKKRPAHSFWAGDWVLAPGATEVRLEANRTERLWLTLHVPPDASAGLYHGMLTFTSDASERAAVPLRARVLPADLEPVSGVQRSPLHSAPTFSLSRGADPSPAQSARGGQEWRRHFACLSTVSPYTQYFDPKKREALKPAVVQFYRDMREHGMTSASLKCTDWPYRPGKFPGLIAEVEAALEAGLTGPILYNVQALINSAKGGERYAHFDGKCDNWDEARDLANLRDIVRTVKRLERERGWPEVIFYTIDEPGTQTENWAIRAKRMDIMVKTLKAVDELGARGVTTVTELVDDRHNTTRWCHEPDELRRWWDLARPYCHIRIYGYSYPQGKTSLFAEQADAQKRGHQVWFYNNEAILGNDRYGARVYFGLWGWKVRAHGLTAWTRRGPRTVQWELVREGIDDARYLALIETLIAEGRGDEVTLALAKEVLARLRHTIHLDANGYLADWRHLRADPTGPRPLRFRRLKPRLAKVITSLAR